MLTSSLQFRVPLTLVISAFTTTLIVVLVLALETYYNLQKDQLNQARDQAHALQPVLQQSLKHDDPWQAYTILRGPTDTANRDESAEIRVLLDAGDRIFSSGKPRAFPIGQDITDLAPYLRASLKSMKTQGKPTYLKHGERIILLLPIIDEETLLGTLIYFTRSDLFWSRFNEIMKSAGIATLLILALLAPVGWVLGKRLVTPLSRLLDCMQQVGKKPIQEIECIHFPRQDEISRLGQQFSRMLEDLRLKQELENQLVTQDRLAAVGRLAGGVAHEINNPLAGMMVAIDTWKNTPESQRDNHKTLSFMERGLRHIQETVSALLVECRFEKRQLTHEDIDDLETLILAESRDKDIEVELDNRLQEDVDIPATLVRQILLNLSLNAVQATDEKGLIRISARLEGNDLVLEVGDNGVMLKEKALKHLFEPFSSNRPGGTGLGLWVTYETIRQLNGKIRVASTREWTSFHVTLPQIDDPVMT